MAEKSIHQPHDKLFKSTFGEPANTSGFLRGELPASFSAAFDWDQLRLEPGSLIDSHYRHSESDLLFSAPLHGQDCLIYVLFEHLFGRPMLTKPPSPVRWRRCTRLKSGIPP